QGADAQRRSGHDVGGGRHQIGNKPGNIHGENEQEITADDRHETAPLPSETGIDDRVDELDDGFKDALYSGGHFLKAFAGEEPHPDEESDHDQPGVDYGAGDRNRSYVEDLVPENVW